MSARRLIETPQAPASAKSAANFLSTQPTPQTLKIAGAAREILNHYSYEDAVAIANYIQSTVSDRKRMGIRQ